MIVSNWDKDRLLRSSILAGFFAAGLTAAPAFAQQADDEDDDDQPVTLQEEAAQEAEQDEDRIVVTGSRIARSTFSSPSPLQVVDTDDARRAGLIDAASIVQRTSVASGQQFDQTFTGQVTDSGPGSSTVSLRGLDAERTLVLFNGRRVAPAGVRGAPTRPDLSLIPTALVERFDILTDGASSVYGSDAVAGVVNVITRSEFDGFEVDTFYSQPEPGGGVERRVSIATGASNSRGYVGFGFEYYTRDEVRRGERKDTFCERDVEVNPETGEIREICQQNSFGNMFLDPAAIFGAPGYPGLGPDFATVLFDFDDGSGFFNLPANNQPFGPGDGDLVQNPDGTYSVPPGRDPNSNPCTGDFDACGLGSRWLYDPRYNANSGQDEFDLIQGVTRFSAYTNGQYDLDLWGNAEVFFEALHSVRTQEIFAGRNQIFPSIDPGNPFVEDDPVLSQTVAAQFGIPLIWLPIIDNTAGPINLDVSATRGVLGLRGDFDDVLPAGAVQFGNDDFGISLANWTWDFYGSHDRNVGIDTQETLNEERVSAALNNVTREPDGTFSCSSVESDLFAFITAEECVPLDITDPEIYITGDLPQDFLDYASGLASTRTIIEQSLFQGTVAGDLAYLPAGTVPLVLGVEYRKDRIVTENSFLITSGAGTGRNETDTIGDTITSEFFLETEVPILTGLPFAEELTITGAARYTDEENFGDLWTYRVQGLYRPTDWLTLRSTYGTTFRAPNLREQFLGGQQSFGSAFADPCVSSTFNGLDPEEQARVRENCDLQGADVDTLGQGGATTIPVISGGFRDLEAETSESISAGIIAEQPVFDSFDFRVAVNYFSIEIEDSIEEPTLGLILNACLIESEQLNSPFCSLIERNSNPSDPSRNFISQINSGFVNVGLIETDGLDFNVQASTDFVVFGEQLDLALNGVATYIMSNRRDIFAEQDTAPIESFRGEYANPLWQGNWTGTAAWRDLELSWTGRYIGEWADDDIDDVRETPIVDAETGITFFEAGFRDVEEAEDKIYHDFSLTYARDTWEVTGGVRNAFDEQAPIVSRSEGIPNSANVVIGGGYDLFGRTFFASVTKAF